MPLLPRRNAAMLPLSGQVREIVEVTSAASTTLAEDEMPLSSEHFRVGSKGGSRPSAD